MTHNDIPNDDQKINSLDPVVRRSHILKTWPVYFDALWDGQKTFEIRKNDRGYQAGDRLVLQEYDPERGAYLDREIHADVTYRMPGGRWGVAEDYCVMALRIIRRRWRQTPNTINQRDSVS